MTALIVNFINIKLQRKCLALHDFRILNHVFHVVEHVFMKKIMETHVRHEY